uniref:bifunctional adenosylcobinamide kinase/adenosylcobinamide-phosphate guanylyltransferase n=1 Tax=Eubacterium cellulosolvens TaxID=29322 RepID=UPI0004818F37|nr:bifunctional adenosylcobinamide kinase/adenosylcobinamide-phosphate guanylyltransferase [[Eubacterium] cellulosolvens]
MKLIIGGSFQGKTAYAERKYGISPDAWIDGNTCEPDEIYHCTGIRHFHDYIRRYTEKGLDPEMLCNELIEKNPDLIVVSDEIGCGLVPMDPFDRLYRERVGQICTRLAAFSGEVVRVSCGIGISLKGSGRE